MHGGWRRFTTDQSINIPNTHSVPNARSPGTPVCHPNDAYKPPVSEPAEQTNKEQPQILRLGRRGDLAQDDKQKPRANANHCEYIELHATSAFSFLAGATLPEQLI